MASLREKLLRITLNASIDEHPTCIEALRSELDHSVVVMKSEYPIDRYTCAVHAFHLIEDPNYIAIAESGLGRTFAGAEFVEFLLQTKLLTPRNPSSVVSGDLIFYFDNGAFRHVGRIKTQTRVLSKWGTGLLYEHGVLEVPSSYGEEIRYFVGPDKVDSLNLFIQYAESKGFR